MPKTIAILYFLALALVFFNLPHLEGSHLLRGKTVTVVALGK